MKFLDVGYRFIISVAAVSTVVLGSLFSLSSYEMIRTREERFKEKVLNTPLRGEVERDETTIKQDLLEVEKRLIKKGLLLEVPKSQKLW